MNLHKVPVQPQGKNTSHRIYFFFFYCQLGCLMNYLLYHWPPLYKFHIVVPIGEEGIIFQRCMSKFMPYIIIPV